jgi:phenylacetate-coenzyme A ligase PaaK-like adenylate-forming protein
MKLDNPIFDSMTANDRDHLLLEALCDQIAFMRSANPFWNERLARAAVDETKIAGFVDLARIPILTKHELRSLRPAVLLPQSSGRDIAIGRWTSGTSGRPTVNLWSTDGYAALVAVTARMLARQAPTERPSVFNVYSQAHMTGPLYHAALSRLGAVVFDRGHHAEEIFPTSAQAELFDFDTLVAPSKAVRGKGVGLQTLQEEDADFLSRHGVRWWIGSSGTFDPDTIASARRQGVEAISNLYGCSEFGLFAISCPLNPGDFYVAQGHVFVEVVDQNGMSVRDGQFGRTLVTHLRGMDREGNSCQHGALRYCGSSRATAQHILATLAVAA